MSYVAGYKVNSLKSQLKFCIRTILLLKMTEENPIDAITVKIEVEKENDMSNELTECLFCLEVAESNGGEIPPLPGSGGNGTMNQEIWAFFILRHFLELPVRDIPNLLLKAEGKPLSSCFVLCNTCIKTVTKALDIHVKVLKMTADLKRLQTDVKQKIQMSESFENGITSIGEEIRSYFKENDFSSSNMFLTIYEQSPIDFSNDDQDYDDYDDPLYSPSCSTKKQLKRQRINPIKRSRARKSDLKTARTDQEEQPNSCSENESGSKNDNVEDDEEIQSKRKRSNVKEAGDHSEKLEWRCQLCLFDRKFRDSSALARHMRIHQLSKSSCPKCNYPCLNKSTLKRHLRNNKCNPSYDFKCDMCDFVTERSCNLSQHKAAKHPLEEQEKGTDSESDDNAQEIKQRAKPRRKNKTVKGTRRIITTEKGGEMRCQICLSNRKFRDSSALAKHMRIHKLSKSSCPKCNYPCLNESTLERHLRNDKCNPSYDFKCDMCDFVTERSCNLSQHKAAKHPLEELENEADSESDDNAQDLEEKKQRAKPKRTNRNAKGIRRITTEKGETRCQICLSNRKYRDSSALARHMRIHQVSRFSCPKCNYPCLNESTLERHLQNDKCNPSYDFKCDMCDFVTERSCNLSQHKAAKHPSEELEKGTDSESDDDDNDINETTQRAKPKSKNRNVKGTRRNNMDIRCQLCLSDRKFRDSSALARHMRFHQLSKFSCPKCNYPCLNESTLERHLTYNKCNPSYDFKCDMCDFVTERSCNLSQHKAAKHDSEEPDSETKVGKSQVDIKGRKKKAKPIYKCDICGLQTKYKERFNSHLRKHQYFDNCEKIGDKLKCQICGDLTGGLNALRQHYRENHSSELGISVFQCSMCVKTFSRQDSMHHHIAEVHTKQCRFNCELCDFKTMKKNALIYHMQRHSSEKNFICDLCAAPFKSEATFRSHMRKTHDPSRQSLEFKCKYCIDSSDSVFLNKSLLTRHQKAVHQDLFVHKCDQCENAYLSSKSLELHKSINHSDDAEVECQFCHVKVMSPYYLHQHYQRVCKKKPPGFSLKPSTT